MTAQTRGPPQPSPRRPEAAALLGPGSLSFLTCPQPQMRRRSRKTGRSDAKSGPSRSRRLGSWIWFQGPFFAFRGGGHAGRLGLLLSVTSGVAVPPWLLARQPLGEAPAGKRVRRWFLLHFLDPRGQASWLVAYFVICAKKKVSCPLPRSPGAGGGLSRSPKPAGPGLCAGRGGSIHPPAAPLPSPHPSLPLPPSPPPSPGVLLVPAIVGVLSPSGRWTSSVTHMDVSSVFGLQFYLVEFFQTGLSSGSIATLMACDLSDSVKKSSPPLRRPRSHKH